MLILLASLILLLLILVWERVLISRTRQKIALVIAVTGSRGKSSVARALGAVLREGGRRVFVKTTGTEPQCVLLDGSIEQVVRRGSPTVLEQKAILRKAARCGADVLVAEIMSIGRDCHVMESHRILRPDIVVITNIRHDHSESMGSTLEEIADTIMLDIVPGSQVFAPQSQAHLFRHLEAATWHRVQTGEAEETIEDVEHVHRFVGNERLVAAVSRYLAVSEETILRGLGRATFDRGAFRIWRYSTPEKTVFLVNAFAANDPESTHALIRRSVQLLGEHRKIYGIFALRPDRGERTLQWIDALATDGWSFFQEIFLVGDVPRAVSRKIGCSSILAGESPALITGEAVARMEDGSVLFGFGNTHGIGLKLIDHWMKEGTVYGT